MVAWALAQGKQSPNTAAAWLACIAFGIVDGTLFQGMQNGWLQGTIAANQPSPDMELPVPLNSPSFLFLFSPGRQHSSQHFYAFMQC